MAIQADSNALLRQENADLLRRLAETETALQRTQQTLTQVEHDRRLTDERLALVARATDDALYDWDFRTGQVWSNAAYIHHFGEHSLDVQVDIQEWVQRIHPNERERIWASLREAMTGSGDTWSAEYRYQRADGGYAYVLDRMCIVRDDAGQAIRMTGAMLDLSGRHQAEDKFAKAFSLSPLMLSLTSLADGRLIDVNQSLLDATGCSREEVLGRTPVELGWWVHPEERQSGLSLLRQQGRIQNQEIVFRMRNREERTCLCSVEIIELNDQPCVLTALVDITERKQAEEALRENQHMLSLIMRGGRIGSWWRNVVTNEVWWSHELEELFGLEPGGFGGTEERFYALVHPDDRPAIASAVEAALAGRSDYVVEFRFYRADGSMGWMEGRGRATYTADGQIIRLYGIGMEITGRRQAEDGLRETTQRLRAIYDGTHEYIGLLTPDGTLLEANRASLEFDQNQRDDVVGLPFWEAPWFRYTPGAPERVRQAVAQAAQTFVRFQMPIRTRSGEARTFDLSFYPIRDERGSVVLIVPEGRDITDLKQVEERLRQSEARQSFLLKLSDALRPLADPIIIQAEAARVLGKHLGTSRAQYGEVEADDEHVTIWRDYADGVAGLAGRLHMADFGASIIAQLRAGHTLVTHDIALNAELTPAERATYAGVEIVAHVEVPLVKNGRFVAFLSVQQNKPRVWHPDEVALVEETAERTWAFIERARAEAALRESERQMQHIADAMPQLVWLADSNGVVSYYNQRANEFDGLKKGADGTWRWEPVVHPDDAVMTERAWQNATQTEQPYDMEHRLRMKDGSYRWHLSRAYPGRDINDRIRMWYGTATDIHDLKQAEESLQTLNTTLEARVAERTAELRESQAQLRQLSVHTERMRENERTRIAREVHDELGGSLTALKMTLARARKGREDDSDLVIRLGDMRNQIDELVQTVRRMASDLRPPMLDDFGLMAALRWQAGEWERRTGIPCLLELPAQEVLLDRERRTAVFRVFQESLTNVARHAQATQVTTVVRENAGQLVMTVHDNGRGIDPDALRPGRSLGLLGIRERIREVAGQVEINSAPDTGTTVMVRVPLEAMDAIEVMDAIEAITSEVDAMDALTNLKGRIGPDGLDGLAEL